MRHVRPIKLEVTITATPIHIPSPPCENLKIAAIVIAIIVGMAPKNKPEIDNSTERLSKIMPDCNVHGKYITITAISPTRKPANSFPDIFLMFSSFAQKKS